MTILSFYWGQKFYKVPYDIWNALFYFALALVLYFASIELRPDNQTLVYIINSMLLIVFCAVFVIKEKAWRMIKK
jgi:uncharacterized membrane protein